MITIRKEQMEAFRAEAMLRFEDKLVAHVAEHFPDQYQSLGDGGTRAMIRQGIKRAGSYGIVTEPGVAAYIKLMFLLGRNFDVDPDLPWAQRVLSGTIYKSEESKVNQLVKEAYEHLAEKPAAE